jgi:two-component system chemotaxis response regulator CheY
VVPACRDRDPLYPLNERWNSPIGTIGQGGSKTVAHDILAVDDSPSMRALVSATLAEAGYKVLQAGDGVQALELAKKETVRLVVADVNMPRMDGLSLLKNLRGMASYKFVPILILTTEISAEKKAEAKSAGATGWLVKPFDPATLINTIKRVIK